MGAAVYPVFKMIDARRDAASKRVRPGKTEIGRRAIGHGLGRGSDDYRRQGLVDIDPVDGRDSGVACLVNCRPNGALVGAFTKGHGTGRGSNSREVVRCRESYGHVSVVPTGSVGRTVWRPSDRGRRLIDLDREAVDVLDVAGIVGAKEVDVGGAVGHDREGRALRPTLPAIDG